MSAPTIKPGTRCECRRWHLGHRGWTALEEQMSGMPAHTECGRAALRQVRVNHRHHEHTGEIFYDEIPMCAPCAAHAEKGGTK
jgi:hypothetical protein